MEKDVYKTILKANEPVLFKDRNSKFYGYAFSVKIEENINDHIEVLKKEHHKAGHFCYAYQLGKTYSKWRANDDGEPSNSAGMPIYGQLQSFELTNVLVVVVRYFGGTKLGVGGLINAYKTTAQMALDACKIIKGTINIQYEVSCEYADLNKVMRVVKERNLKIIDQVMSMRCKLTIAVREKQAETIHLAFENIYGVKIIEIED